MYLKCLIGSSTWRNSSSFFSISDKDNETVLDFTSESEAAGLFFFKKCAQFRSLGTGTGSYVLTRLTRQGLLPAASGLLFNLDE
jgi:predicted aconitase with swiveling domain